MLNERSVQYLIVGGHAAIAYGSARFTEARVPMELEPGLVCPYLSLDHLLKNKAAVARPKDIADLMELEKVKRLKEK